VLSTGSVVLDVSLVGSAQGFAGCDDGGSIEPDLIIAGEPKAVGVGLFDNKHNASSSFCRATLRLRMRLYCFGFA
jgi:hypothetical protein